MRLLETYSRNCSVEIKHKPFLYERYFPLNIEKYITFQNKSGMPAKDYTHWAEVISLISPYLEKENIKILLLGSQDAPPADNVIDLRGKTTISQCFYLLRRSLLHFGNDSWCCHAAGAENVPLVSIYGSTTVNNHSPYFYDKEKTIFLESHRNGNKATYAREEMPKTVDLVHPEIVAAAILKLLNIKFDYPYNTLYIGQSYNQRVVESCCDVPINISNLGINNLIMRMDLTFNENVLAQQLQNNDCSIVTDKPINPNLLAQFRPRIKEFVYIITKEHKPDFVNILQQLGINYLLISYLEPEELNSLKLDYIDFKLIHPQSAKKTLKDLDETKNENPADLVYKSKKFLLSQGKIFAGESAWRKSIESKSLNPEIAEVINDEYFMKELNNFIILKKVVDKSAAIL